MATKKTKAPAKKEATKKQATKSKSVSTKNINNLVDGARELAENQISSIEIAPEIEIFVEEEMVAAQEPEIIMTTPDAFNSAMGDDVPTAIVSVVNTQPAISDQQRALNAIDGLKEKIQFNIHQKQAEVAKAAEVVVEVVEEKVEVVTEPAPVLSQEQIEENLFTQFLAARPGATEINHFELSHTGINVARFEHLEGRVGKYKLSRVYMGGPWTFTITK